MSRITFTRRKALESLGILIAGSSLAQAQGKGLTGETPAPPVQLTPLDEVADIPLFEEEAKKKLSKEVFTTIAGSEREGFDRMTLKPHYMIDTMNMDVSIKLLGDKMVAPILVGATPQQKRFHSGGELWTARGASAGKAVLVTRSAFEPLVTAELPCHDRTPMGPSAILMAGMPRRALGWLSIHPEPASMTAFSSVVMRCNRSATRASTASLGLR